MKKGHPHPVCPISPINSEGAIKLSLFNLAQTTPSVKKNAQNPYTLNRETLLLQRSIEPNPAGVNIPTPKNFSEAELATILDGYFRREGSIWTVQFGNETLGVNADGIGGWMAGSIAKPDWLDSPIPVQDTVIITPNAVQAALCWAKNLPAWIIPETPDASAAFERLVQQIPACADLMTVILDEPDDPSWTRKVLNALRGKGFRGMVVDLVGQPLDDKEPQAPLPPVDVLPPPIHDYIIHVAKATGTPEDYAFTAFWGVASVIIGNRFEMIDKADHRVRGHLALGIVGPSGSAKSPVLSLVLKPIRTIYHEVLNPTYQTACEADPENPPLPFALMLSDTTKEGLLDVLSANPHGLLIRQDELIGFIRGMDAYRNGRGGDLQFFLSLLSGQDVQTTRKTTSSVYLEDPFVSLVGNLTPDGLRFFIDKQQSENGFLPRFLFTFPDPLPAQGVPEWEIPDSVSHAYGNILEDLFRTTWVNPITPIERREVITWATTDAKSLYHAWTRQNMEDDDGGNFGAFCSKLNDNVLRFALILTVLRGMGLDPRREAPLSVTEDTLCDAIRVAEYFKAMTRRVYPRAHASAEEAKLQRIEDWLKRREVAAKPTTLRHLQQAKTLGQKADTILPLLEKLEQAGRVWRDGREWHLVKGGERT